MNFYLFHKSLNHFSHNFAAYVKFIRLCVIDYCRIHFFRVIKEPLRLKKKRYIFHVIILLKYPLIRQVIPRRCHTWKSALFFL